MKQAVSGIIIKDNYILLIKRGRNTKLEPGKWFVPGGKTEEGETVEQTIVREVKEELNLDFIPGSIFQEGIDVGMKFYKVLGTASGVIQLQKEEIDGYGWFTYEEAKKLELALDMEQVLEELYSKKLLG